MHVIKYDRKNGQLETTGGYEIIGFKVNSSSITITTVDDRGKRLDFSSSKCVQVYSSVHNNPILTLGGN